MTIEVKNTVYYFLNQMDVRFFQKSTYEIVQIIFILILRRGSHIKNLALKDYIQLIFIL